MFCVVIKMQPFIVLNHAISY